MVAANGRRLRAAESETKKQQSYAIVGTTATTIRSEQNVTMSKARRLELVFENHPQNNA